MVDANSISRKSLLSAVLLVIILFVLFTSVRNSTNRTITDVASNDSNDVTYINSTETKFADGGVTVCNSVNMFNSSATNITSQYSINLNSCKATLQDNFYNNTAIETNYTGTFRTVAITNAILEVAITLVIIFLAIGIILAVVKKAE